MLDLSTLNPAQRQAVETTEGPLLVLAGAGSGKTRVLTTRVAHLVEDLGVNPWNILAVTFTNKAANEMRERLGQLLPRSLRGMWIYTFHSMCVRMLRADAELLGYTNSFTIYDADDSKRLVKDIMDELGIDKKRFPDAGVRSRISSLKNDLVSADAFEGRTANPFENVVARVYKRLQERLQRANAMDFDDLLCNAYVLLRDHADVREAYGERFHYILVDEYQDTNRAQYAITELLAKTHGNLMVVGDDDQSIYSWRGADIRNILEFEHDWPNATTVKLEQNYRSTSTILDAANAVIAHNADRKPKKLFTNGAEGEKIAVYLAAEERDEGRWIAGEVEKLHDAGTAYANMALFYRTNAQSRALEDMFLRAGVPYRIVGGTRFFDRAEIRDVTAYLKLAVNPADDMSAQRIVNVPRRGIGKTTIERVNATAQLRGMTFLEAVREEALDPSTRPATRKALSSFTELIDEIRSYQGDLADVVRMVVEKSGLEAALEAQRTDEAKTRVENIREFFSVVSEYVETHELVPDEETRGTAAFDADDAAALELFGSGDEIDPLAGFHRPTLADFMEWVSLRTDLDTVGEGDDDYVTFMTVHSAKGLEFDVVFVAGMEEGIFPHRTSVEEHGVEEERRLAYVAITRARKRLFLTHAQTRRVFGSTQANAASRFVGEIPDELLRHEGVGSLGYAGFGWEKRGDRRGISGSGRGEDVYGGRVFGSGGHVDAHKISAGNTQQDFKKSAADVDFAKGDHVEHKTFGPGTVVGVDGDKLTVHFAKSGKTKKLLKGYAPLVKVDKQ